MSSSKSTNITWHGGEVSSNDRLNLLKQKKGAVLWLTGLSGSGKSTLSVAMEKRLITSGYLCNRLDGDNIRHGLNGDLGFSPSDRKENIRRIAEVAKLMAEGIGSITCSAFISPLRQDRQMARDIVGSDSFIEIFVKVPLSVAEERDPKGLYAKARSGEIKNFTGIDAPYEEPESAELVLDTSALSIDECTEEVMKYLLEKGIIGEV